MTGGPKAREFFAGKTRWQRPSATAAATSGLGASAAWGNSATELSGA